MKISFATGLSVLAVSSLLAGCQTTKQPAEVETQQEQTSESHTHDHEHSHADDEESNRIYEGFFEDSQVGDRPLTDWEGDWQSVYPYLQDGTLDKVFAYKNEQDDAMTSEEYKEYYKNGYQTDVERIMIQDNNVTFFKNGKEQSGEYTYDGYEILTYEAGNKGVRYIFKLVEKRRAPSICSI